MNDFEGILRLFEILKPLNQTLGEHSVSVILKPGVKGGTIKFMLNDKTFIGEYDFSDIDDAPIFLLSFRASCTRKKFRGRA